MDKAQYKTEKRQLDSEFYQTKVQRLGVRNQIESQRLETANVRFETVQELHSQATDRLQATQAMTPLLQAHYTAEANRLLASTAKVKARTQELLDDTQYLFGSSAVPSLGGQ
jgi:hypothetical protein